MKTTFPTALVLIFAAAVGVAATSLPQARLTVQRALQLTAPTDAPAAANYHVKISDLGETVLSPTAGGKITHVQEAVFPTEFLPPMAAPADSVLAILPSTPTNFDKI